MYYKYLTWNTVYEDYDDDDGAQHTTILILCKPLIFWVHKYGFCAHCVS